MNGNTDVIPFAARAHREPYSITIKAGSVQYDADRQVTIMDDGSLFCESRLPQSCTGTNWDSKPDDTADPYLFL